MLQSGSLHMDLHGVHTHTNHHKPESMITHPPTSPPASTQICVPHQTHSHNKHAQQTHATNSRNCSFVLSHPPHRTHIHPNSFPAEPKCFRVLFAPAEALAEGSKISLAGRQVPKPRCLSPAAHSLDVRIAGCQVPKPRWAVRNTIASLHLM